MASLNKEQILGATDIKYQVVPVPEWGGDVRIRSMTGADRDAYEQWMISRNTDSGVKLDNLRARMAAISIVGDDGERLFADDDIAALGKKSAAALGRVFDAVTALNVIAPADIEAVAKN
jgi:hypothetical protein